MTFQEIYLKFNLYIVTLNPAFGEVCFALGPYQFGLMDSEGICVIFMHYVYWHIVLIANKMIAILIPCESL